MVERGRGPRLAIESLDQLGRGAGDSRQLEGHLSIELKVIGQVDRSHPSLPECFQHAIAAESFRQRNRAGRGTHGGSPCLTLPARKRFVRGRLFVWTGSTRADDI